VSSGTLNHAIPVVESTVGLLYEYVILYNIYTSVTSVYHERLWYNQWLKWKIRGEGTVYQLWAKMSPQQVVRTLFMKFEVWERWISVTGGAGTAFPCVHGTLTTGNLFHDRRARANMGLRSAR